jgi:hypothetical protein
LAVHILARSSKYLEFPVALLIAGSAISLISCGEPAKNSEVGDEKIITRTVRDMERLSTENGAKKQLMRAPLMEEHAFAKDAFMEFREGMEVIGFDSLGLNPSSRVVADHALHWTARDLWQLSGNVVVEGEEGQKLYTQQLFWDAKTHKIWSNIDSKLEEDGGVLHVVSFEAMDDFSRFEGRNGDGTMEVDVEPVESPPADSVAVVSDMPLPAATPTAPAALAADSLPVQP